MQARSRRVGTDRCVTAEGTGSSAGGFPAHPHLAHLGERHRPRTLAVGIRAAHGQVLRSPAREAEAETDRPRVGKPGRNGLAASVAPDIFPTKLAATDRLRAVAFGPVS